MAEQKDIWAELKDAEDARRIRDLRDLHSGRRGAPEINARNSVLPGVGELQPPADLSSLEFDWDE